MVRCATPWPFVKQTCTNGRWFGFGLWHGLVELLSKSVSEPTTRDHESELQRSLDKEGMIHESSNLSLQTTSPSIHL